MHGISNFHPSRQIGEDNASMKLHTEYLLQQAKLKPDKQDTDRITSRMNLTFADCRDMIIQGSSVTEIREQYPLLFSKTQLTIEFLQLMQWSLCDCFNKEMQRYGDRIVALKKPKHNQPLADEAHTLMISCRDLRRGSRERLPKDSGISRKT